MPKSKVKKPEEEAQEDVSMAEAPTSGQEAADEDQSMKDDVVEDPNAEEDEEDEEDDEEDDDETQKVRLVCLAIFEFSFATQNN